MAHIPGHDRSQMLLLPEAVDDYVGPDNPVRFLRPLWMALTYRRRALLGSNPKQRVGPAMRRLLLKLYIYGYLNRVRSSRRLEAEAGRNDRYVSSPRSAGRGRDGVSRPGEGAYPEEARPETPPHPRPWTCCLGLSRPTQPSPHAGRAIAPRSSRSIR